MQFRNEFYFLSNMYPCHVTYDGLTFECAEAAFQAAKCSDKRKDFTFLNGYDAKRLGRLVSLRKDWEQVKDRIMYEIVKAKFEQNEELFAKLKNISGEICEENTWHDTYWGICNGYGKNMLGKILMKIREGE